MGSSNRTLILHIQRFVPGINQKKRQHCQWMLVVVWWWCCSFVCVVCASAFRFVKNEERRWVFGDKGFVLIYVEMYERVRHHMRFSCARANWKSAPSEGFLKVFLHTHFQLWDRTTYERTYNYLLVSCWLFRECIEAFSHASTRTCGEGEWTMNECEWIFELSRQACEVY